MIYFAIIDSDTVKIGYTEDIGQRRVVLAECYGPGAAILTTPSGDERAEAEVHRRFAHLRIDQSDLYKIEEDLLEFIGQAPNPSSR